MKVKATDNVLVITGKDKGKTGTVLKTNPGKKQIVVEKINFRTKHIKKSANGAGQKIKYEAPITVSNVMLVCPSCSKATRVGYQIPQEGKKIRICKKCNASLDKAFQKKKSK